MFSYYDGMILEIKKKEFGETHKYVEIKEHISK